MIIQSLIWGLEELADRDLQERLWTGKVEGEMSTFDEAICSTFTDSDLGRTLDRKKTSDFLNDTSRKKAKQLRVLVRQIPHLSAPEDIISHPLMNEVRSLASELLSEFRKFEK